jgi:hypothetical protein
MGGRKRAATRTADELLGLTPSASDDEHAARGGGGRSRAPTTVEELREHTRRQARCVPCGRAARAALARWRARAACLRLRRD